MKKIILGLILVIGLLGLAVPSIAHGTCTASSRKPLPSGGTVFFTGTYSCGTTFHSINMTVFAQRRNGGSTGSFSNISSASSSNPNTTQRTAQASLPFDCHKDYRTLTTGNASPGGHSSSGAPSTILQNTC